MHAVQRNRSTSSCCGPLGGCSPTILPLKYCCSAGHHTAAPFFHSRSVRNWQVAPAQGAASDSLPGTGGLGMAADLGPRAAGWGWAPGCCC